MTFTKEKPPGQGKARYDLAYGICGTQTSPGAGASGNGGGGKKRRKR